MVDLETIQYMTRKEADMSQKMRVQTIFEYVEPRDDMRILDLPCGRGFYLNMLRYVSQCQLVGADLTEEYAYFIAQTLDEYLQQDTSRLAIDERGEEDEALFMAEAANRRENLNHH